MEASEAELLELTRVRADAGLATQLRCRRPTAQPPAFAHPPRPHPPPHLPPRPPNPHPRLRAANARILAAMARAGMARAELYPRIVLTGLLGRQGASLSNLSIGAGNFFGIGPSITLPIFNAGRIRSQIAAEQAAVSEASAAYEQEVLPLKNQRASPPCATCANATSGSKPPKWPATRLSPSRASSTNVASPTSSASSTPNAPCNQPNSPSPKPPPPNASNSRPPTGGGWCGPAWRRPVPAVPMRK
ncbi:MAG: TolC family protein [Bryobacterales bacterium]|nr:TolC family protein [Bryobacterales bacterium]